MCERPKSELPCFTSIMVLGGVEPVCRVCAPNLDNMRDQFGYVKCGDIWFSDQIHDEQKQYVRNAAIAKGMRVEDEKAEAR